MSLVKIVATVGPATERPEQLEALVRAGVDVIRLNLAHGTHDQHRRVFHTVREISARLDQPVAVLQDLGGPKIRVGTLAGGGPVQLIDGEEVVITTKRVTGNANVISTNYEHLIDDVRPGDTILLADGSIALRVIKKGRSDIHASIVHGGVLTEHQGINLPGVAISAPGLTAKDRDDLDFGVALGVDYLALSFVRRPEDVLEAKRMVAERKAKTPVIAKLEKREAIDRLDEILAVADGVMVARGDLGVELPLEQVPILQKLIIRRANEQGVVVITATQMLESMVHSPRPTRAEVSDVANAILDGTDAVMLSGETAVGEFPMEAVEVMDRIANVTVAAIQEPTPPPKTGQESHAISQSAVRLASSLGARAIVVFTRSGHTARLLSKERPAIPIIALTDSESVYRRLALWWGVTPVYTAFQAHTDLMIAHAQRELLTRQLLNAGDQVVIVSYPLAPDEHPNIAVVEVR